MEFIREIGLFEEEMNCSLAFHDLLGELSTLAAPGRIAHHHENPLCEKIRSSGASAYAACCACDVNEVGRRIMEGRPFWKVCHAGFREAVFPILKFGRPAAVMFAGVFAPPPGTEPRRKGTGLPLDEAPEPLLFWGGLFADHIRLRLEELPDMAPQTRRSDRIRCWFIHNFRDPDCTLAGLAEELGVSESRTSHLLRQELGKSFPALLGEYRLECAKQILSRSQLSVEAAARMAGFRSANYLHRCFRRRFGMTPDEFRRGCVTSFPGGTRTPPQTGSASASSAAGTSARSESPE
ncbi:MAG: helix-turn-helix transcriptional regulator [Lentisphaeria bacterium]|nr:helix-turn-helix transcriptional regulator [Lentisphaeria bacterium]